MPIQYRIERLQLRGARKIVAASRPFTIRIDTTKAGSASDQFVLPLNSSYSYDFDINWGDGAAERVTTNVNKTHVYDTPGVYDIRIYREFPSIQFGNQGDKAKIIEILQWGSIEWSTMEFAFYGCSNLTNVSATDTIDLRNVKELTYLFTSCSELTGVDVSNWNTENIESINAMFYGCSKLTGIDVSNWNTANIKFMELVFYNCTLLNTDISSFNISSLTNANNMMRNSAFGNSNYDLMLTAWNAFGTNNVKFHAGTAKYSAGGPAAARASMVSRGWTITDGGPA